MVATGHARTGIRGGAVESGISVTKMNSVSKNLVAINTKIKESSVESIQVLGD
jgi:hypothetical protein